jgi:hypothetical protein|tara:strand:- start:1844 stop:2035 length:192 start_codon:yes stop_codon:yes gene_type:complete
MSNEWEVGLSSVFDLTTEEAQKVYRMSNEEKKEWLRKQVDEGNISIVEIYNPKLDSYEPNNYT